YTSKFVKRSGRALQSRLRSLWGEYHCPVCNSRAYAFQPLPDYFNQNLEKYGWPYKPDEAETCNHLGYLCPLCFASDRDRLYALYLMAYLRGSQSNAAVRI